MLARLSEVPWESLGAAELPGLLTGIAASEREEALAALDEVRARVWQDGEIFELTPQVTPFLVELSTAPGVTVRPPILQLLAFLFTAQGPPAALEATRAAVRRGLGSYIELLTDEDRDVRLAGACLLTGFRDRDAEVEVRRALTLRVREEEDEVIRANLVASLAVHLPTAHLEAYDTTLERDPSLLVRREAAHNLAAVLRENTPVLAVGVLLEAILKAAELAPLYAGVAWARRGLVADTCWAITRLGSQAPGYLRYLVKLLAKAMPEDALAIGEACLLIAFGGPAPGRALSDLTPEQLAVAHALVDNDAIWGRQLEQMLSHYGLPGDQAELRAYLTQA